ncbi:cytochrome P450 [Ktedonospora formicarum]|uniref:Cytochrome P450 n=1 Tax=Ktedonospora formicarum TaxID=2778364 RepID=A0A8J3I8E0_9CHLR|nr:cytochrome P450 [Ktedonospora formicarum]GHO49351.1 cytochrome P450 [Ktedonospora formicarum]
MSIPSDPLTAVTHSNPYPYYAHLVEHRPIYRDTTSGLWVASSANAVSAVLTSTICRVRPLAEPVPSALLGSPAASIFRHLVRMNDGEAHCPFKQAITCALHSLDARSVTEQCDIWADFLLREHQESRSIQGFAFNLPVYVIASLLGIPQDKLYHTALWVSDFVRCIAPASSTEQIERGKLAAGHLFDLFHTLLQTHTDRASSNLLMALKLQAQDIRCEDRDTIVANSIGFLSQAYEATAGLIGNTIVALATHHHAYEQVRSNPTYLSLIIEEVLRYDPPIQNTRRFLAQDGYIAGQKMQVGDTVLVVLAAANRDPDINPHSERFEAIRDQRRMFTFGAGPHICPGQTLAAIIAQSGIRRLLAAGFAPEHLTCNVTYRPSANARIALLVPPDGK